MEIITIYRYKWKRLSVSRSTEKFVPRSVYSYDIDKWTEQVFLWSQTVTGKNVFATCCAILLFEHTKENTNAGIDESCTC